MTGWLVWCISKQLYCKFSGDMYLFHLFSIEDFKGYPQSTNLYQRTHQEHPMGEVNFPPTTPARTKTPINFIPPPNTQRCLTTKTGNRLPRSSSQSDVPPSSWSAWQSAPRTNSDSPENARIFFNQGILPHPKPDVPQAEPVGWNIERVKLILDTVMISHMST